MLAAPWTWTQRLKMLKTSDICYAFKPMASKHRSLSNNPYEMYSTSYWTEHYFNIEVSYSNEMSNFTPGIRKHMYHMHK